jgi:hypothetical protein
MIIKYGTSEPATLVDAKNIPSWLSDETIPLATGTDGSESSSDQEDSAEEE